MEAGSKENMRNRLAYRWSERHFLRGTPQFHFEGQTRCVWDHLVCRQDLFARLWTSIMCVRQGSAGHSGEVATPSPRWRWGLLDKSPCSNGISIDISINPSVSSIPMNSSNPFYLFQSVSHFFWTVPFWLHLFWMLPWKEHDVHTSF